MSNVQIELDILLPFLRSSVLFHEADDESLQVIASRLEYVRFQKGDPITLENEISDHVYFVFSGTVEVVKNIVELNQVTRLAVLKSGSQFSEFSVLNRSNKGASVFALEDCELLRMSGDVFLEVLGQLPQVAKKLATHIAEMTSHVQASRLSVAYVQTDKISLNKNIPRLMPQGMWRKFEVLPIRYDHQSLFVAMKNPKNQEFYNFMRQNHPNLQLYVSIVGNLDFDSIEKQLSVAYANRNANMPQDLTVPTPLQGETIEWLAQISLFRNVPADWFEQLSQYIEIQDFAAGQPIYARGQPSDRLYLVHSGLVDFSFPLDQQPHAAVFVGSSGPGDYFSEVSLLNNSEHVLSARAATDVRVASLPKDIFDRLLETPFLSVPLACDLALQFQDTNKNSSFPFFDEKSGGVQIYELADVLPKSLIAQYEILPLRLKDNELTIGITNPESDTIYSVISRYLQNYRVKLEIIKATDFKRWWGDLNTIKPGATATVGRPSSANFTHADAVTVLNSILTAGFNDRVSDVHIEPLVDCYIVRYRIDGVLHEGPEKYSKQLGAELLNRIKILSQIDMTQKFTPQDGQLKAEVAGATCVARVSTLPTKRGEKAVLRLIRQKNSVPPLTTIVPDRRVINLLREVVNTRQGVFLVTGPTGSGKSTTLYALLRELNRVDINIISLEDPVEMEIAGTTQVEMNEKGGMTFAVALRSALRQDPNVIMVGEIRDEESAKIAFHAASTGHLVISTLHTNDSLNVIPRLLELGVSKGALASTLIGASAQRLLRHVCQKCRETRAITEAEIAILKTELRLEKVPTEIVFGKGCAHCNHSGYHGRIPIIEIWNKTKAVESALSKPFELETLVSELEANGFETLRQFALKMVCNGLTTFEEVHRGVGGAQVHHHGEPEKLAG